MDKTQSEGLDDIRALIAGLADKLDKQDLTFRLQMAEMRNDLLDRMGRLERGQRSEVDARAQQASELGSQMAAIKNDLSDRMGRLESGQKSEVDARAQQARELRIQMAETKAELMRRMDRIEDDQEDARLERAVSRTREKLGPNGYWPEPHHTVSTGASIIEPVDRWKRRPGY